MADIFESQSNAIEAFVRELPIANDQIGAVFLLNGEPAGVDLFDHHKTFVPLILKIVRGYALDAIDLRVNKPSSGSTPPHVMRARAEQFMSDVLDAQRTSFDGPGMGEKARLLAPGVTGGALVVDGTLVHMSAFRS